MHEVRGHVRAGRHVTGRGGTQEQTQQVGVLPQGAGGEATAAIAMAIDLAEPAGMRPMPATGGPASQRTLDVEQLSRSIRRRLQALQAGEDVSGRGLPDEVVKHTVEQGQFIYGEGGRGAGGKLMWAAVSRGAAVAPGTPSVG